jgi:hypothetical protein
MGFRRPQLDHQQLILTPDPGAVRIFWPLGVSCICQNEQPIIL